MGDAELRQSAGLSVIGRSANTTGNVADITGTDGQVLRVSGTTLGFGTIPETSITGLCTTSNTVGKGDGAGGQSCSAWTDTGTLSKYTADSARVVIDHPTSTTYATFDFARAGARRLGMGLEANSDNWQIYRATGTAGAESEFSVLTIANSDGAAAFTGTLSTDANLTAGNSDSVDSHTFHGPVAVTSTSATTDVLNAAYTASATTADHVAARGAISGTFDATAADRWAYGLVGEANATRSAGSNNVVNVGAFLSASGGQAPQALRTGFGDVYLNVSSGQTVAFGNLTVLGNTQLGDDATDVLDVNGDLSKFGGSLATDGDTYIYRNQINSGYGSDTDDFVLRFNYVGYALGGTRYRDAEFLDGKGNQACYLDGSAKTFNCVGGLQENGAAVLSGTISQYIVPRGDASGNLEASTIYNDGTATTTGNGDGDYTRVYGDVYVTKVGADSTPQIIFNNDAATWATGIDGSTSDTFHITEAGVSTWVRVFKTTGLLTAVGGGTTPANWTTTGTGDLVSADDLTVGDDATVTGDIDGSSYIASTKAVGATFADLDTGTKANLKARDNTALATGVGGGILFEGVYTGTTIAGAAGIKAMKVNGTDGNYSFDLVFGARQNGNSIAEGCRLYGDTKILNCVGGLQENGAAVLSGTITDNVIPMGTATGNLEDSGLSDAGTQINSSRQNFSINTAGGTSPQIHLTQSGQTQWLLYVPGSSSNFGIWNSVNGDVITLTTNDVSFADAVAVVGNLSTDANLNAGNNATDVHTFNGETIIASGTLGTSSTNGIHFGFASNVGTISSTQPGTANRQLDIQGTPLNLVVGGTTEIAITGSAVTILDETVFQGGTIANTTNGLHVGFASNIATLSAEQPGTAYRQLNLGGSTVRLVTGGSARVDIASTGQVLLGDTSNTAIDNNLDVLTIGNTGTGQTSDTDLVDLSSAATFNLTSADRTVSGAKVTMTNADSAGSNDLFVRAGHFETQSAANAQYAVYAVAHGPGGEGIICPEGCTTTGGALATVVGVYAAATGDNAYSILADEGKAHFADGITVGGSVAAIGAGDGLDDGDETINISPAFLTPLTSSYVAYATTINGEFNTTSGPLTSTGVFAQAITTRDSGSNTLTNYGGFFEASGAQVNYALWTGDGNVHFDHGPEGINNYNGTHLEWADEWVNFFFTTATPHASPIGPYVLGLVGTGTAVANTAAVSGRPGIAQFSTGTTAAGYAAAVTDDEVFSFATQTASIYEWSGTFPTLSVTAQRYQALVGFFDWDATTNPTDGCYFLYDEGDIATNPNTGDTGGISGDFWSIWCASNGTRTGYKLDGTASEDSFTTVSTAVAAGTYDRLRVVMEGTSKARFYNGATEVGRITTNIPNNATTRVFGAGFVILKSNGTTARTMNVDQTRLAIDLTTAR